MLDPIVTALKDDDDDVRAVAASALLPVAESLVMIAPSYVSSNATSTLCHLLLLYAESIQLSSYRKYYIFYFFLYLYFSLSFSFLIFLLSLCF